MNRKQGLIAGIRAALTQPRWGVGDLLYTLFVVILTAVLINRVGYLFSAPRLPQGWVVARESTVTPLQTTEGSIEPETTPTPTPQASLRNIIQYIAQTFEPEGKAVVVEAINCFYSESKLNPLARGCNRNGTCDSGVAQINSIHNMTAEQSYDFRKNIDKAYQIYKERGWAAWYGKGCARLAYQ